MEYFYRCVSNDQTVAAYLEELNAEATVKWQATDHVLPEDGKVTEDDFEYIVNDDGTAEIVDYIGSKWNVEVPATLGGYPVTVIGEDAFREYVGYVVRTVKLPDTVKRIDDRAFFYCANLVSVQLPNSLEHMGKNVFDMTEAKVFNGDGTLWQEEKAETPSEPVDNTDKIKLDNYGKLPGEQVYTVGAEVKDLVLTGTVAGDILISIDRGVEKISNITLGRLHIDFTKNADYSSDGVDKRNYLSPEYYRDILPDLILSLSSEIAPCAFEDSYFGAVTVLEGGNKITPFAFSGIYAKTLAVPHGVTTLCEGAFANAEIGELILPSTVRVIEKNAFVGFKGTVTVAEGTKISEVSELSCAFGLSDSLSKALAGARLTDREADGLLAELDGGFAVSGLEGILLPKDGYYVHNGAFSYFASEENVLIPTERENEAGSFYMGEDGLPYLSYGNGKILCLGGDYEVYIYPLVGADLPPVKSVTLDKTTVEKIEKCFVSETVSWAVVTLLPPEGSNYRTRLLISVSNGGKTVHLGALPEGDDVVFISEKIAICGGGVWGTNSRVGQFVYVSVDGGKTFCNDNIDHISEIFYHDSSTAYNTAPRVLPLSEYCIRPTQMAKGLDYLKYFDYSNFTEYGAIAGIEDVLTPYFVGDVGYCRFRCNLDGFTDEEGKPKGLYVYIVSEDGGESWQLYDPMRRAYLDKINVKPAAEATEEITVGNVTFVKNGNDVTVKGYGNAVIDGRDWGDVYDPSNTAVTGYGLAFRDNGSVPFYHGIHDSGKALYVLGGKLYLSFDNYGRVVEVPQVLRNATGGEVRIYEELYDSQIKYCYISAEHTVFAVNNVLVFTDDMGDSFRIFEFEGPISRVLPHSDGSLEVRCQKTVDGKTVYAAYISRNGGQSFEETDTDTGNKVINGVVSGDLEFRIERVDTDKYTCAVYKNGEYRKDLTPVLGKDYIYEISKDEDLPYIDGDLIIWTKNYLHGYREIIVSVDGGESWVNYSDSDIAKVWHGSPNMKQLLWGGK
ncbi:MAG: hypothetical protein E7619_05985 [Ruminococcaceae bacterium]|nr:hypothetical protein [Oscillospiraceae bacterium]